MRLSKGFSLVEVLVASLMIMLGVTGYVTLQSEYVLADSQLNLRNLALQLAEEKLDELTSVSQLNRNAYDDITTNLGGLIPVGKVDILLGNNQLNIRSFNRTWSVSPLYFIDSDNDGLADLWLSAGHPQLPAQPSKIVSQKDVDVIVGWQDYQGKYQSLSMSGRLSPVFQSSSAFVVTESASIKQRAQIRFTANLLPDSIEQTLAQNVTLQSASPIVAQTGINSEVIMSFERNEIQSGQKIKSSQSDFTTIGCSCQLSGLGMGMTPAMNIIDQNKIVTQAGLLVNKMTGSAMPSKQSVLCQQCCNDHHDSAQTLAAEQFYRSESGLAHGHYKLQTNGSYRPAILAGDVYDEVCRFKRINGDFVLYLDWQLLDILVLSPDFLLNSSNKSAYLAYNEGVIKAAISGGIKPVKPSGRDLSFSLGSFQFTARGLYLDRMRSADTMLIQTKLAKGEPDWLALVPFYDVNLTLLADWHSSQPIIASFTNDPIEVLINPLQQYYGSFSRGWLTTHKAGFANLSASATGYNASLVGLGAVSPFENLSIKQDSSVTIK